MHPLLNLYNTAFSKPRTGAPWREDSQGRARRLRSAKRAAHERQRAATGHNDVLHPPAQILTPNPVKQIEYNKMHHVLYLYDTRRLDSFRAERATGDPLRARTLRRHRKRATVKTHRGTSGGQPVSFRKPERQQAPRTSAHCTTPGGAMRPAQGKPPPGVQSPAITGHPNRPSQA
jgi:hypothetical protein